MATQNSPRGRGVSQAKKADKILKKYASEVNPAFDKALEPLEALVTTVMKKMAARIVELETELEIERGRKRKAEALEVEVNRLRSKIQKINKISEPDWTENNKEPEVILIENTRPE
eukprot:CAMPEP_0168524426 /NCGR_PEP_ID=MMETSP0405-20121227/10645_1 /TAXON_ID=498012 /ORGANISM="Trichosphaerium sp, Strain Am-I-7 wt" /LENGTH=115 /DNA_ID=CAMNT_0008546635 /DNA_START=116 /DNA_END=460 /DNA_ORIENTATION=+